jgi:hypothetical protein
MSEGIWTGNARLNQIAARSPDSEAPMSADDDKAWQELIDEAVRLGLLTPVGLNADGKMMYRRTTKQVKDWDLEEPRG